MFDKTLREGMVLNWRGPLLAAAIFAAAFAILLIMAHQNQSNASDMGSSLREDPYGTSLLFDSFRRAEYQVKRSQDEDSLSEENAATTTAFFIGGHPFPWRMERKNLAGQTFGRRLEDFLARGGARRAGRSRLEIEVRVARLGSRRQVVSNSTSVHTDLDLC